MLFQELNNRFTEATTELLVCVACLNPNDTFSTFDKQRLIRLIEFYPSNFSSLELMKLDDQLVNYILIVRSNNDFLEVKGIVELDKKLVKRKKNLITIGIFACEIIIAFTSCNCYCRKSFLGNEIFKESAG